jgi:hypothetical protein
MTIKSKPLAQPKRGKRRPGKKKKALAVENLEEKTLLNR